MNCQEALSRLYDVIDKEASEIDTHEVEEHLRHCRDCAGVYHLERSVNDLIQEKLAHQRATPRLDSLKAKVLAELDQIDHDYLPPKEVASEKLHKTASRSVFRIGWALAIAASLIVVIGAFLVGRTIFDTHAAYLPLEQAHFAAADHLDSFRNAATTSLARSVAHQSFGYHVAENVNTFTLVGGQPETIDNIPLVHFVYHNDDHVVSVFLIDTSLMAIPDDLLETLVHRNGIQFYDHKCRGCRLVYHKVGNALIVTATTNKDIELLDFVPGSGTV